MTPAYQLTNINYHYNKTLALSLPELNIQSGKITALIGPNGGGKSTLLNLLAFLQKNQQGSIKFFSEPVIPRHIPDYIKRIAFLPQKPYALKGTVVSNLNLALKFHHSKKNIRSAQIENTLEKLNITHLSQQQAKTLSGGELQKVALARAIITNPEVLLMDEPFSFLDPGSEHVLEEFILDFVQENNKTLIFSSHNRLRGIAIADNVISLVKGKLVDSPLINLFNGSSKNQYFNSGKIQVKLADNDRNYQHISIDPHEIVLSRTPLISSMRNQFQGKVVGIANDMGTIRVTVLAEEKFHVLITAQALEELKISLGEKLWVNFKSNSIHAF